MPSRLRDLKRALEALAISVAEPSSGSHWRAVNGSGKSYMIPAGNGLKTEITDIYIKALCRNLGVDEKALRERL